MNKWPSGESSFKRASSTQSGNGAPVDAIKTLYESDVEELKNRLSGQQKQKETQRNTLKNSVLGMGVLTFILAAVSLFLFTKVGSLQNQNKGLTNEVESLKTTIQSLESENKVIQSKITMAEKERYDLKGRIETLSFQKESLEQELRKNQTVIGNTNEEKTYLEEILINKTKEIESLKRNTPFQQSQTGAASAVVPVAANTSASGDLQKLTQSLRDKDAEIARLSEQNRILSNRIDKLYKVTNDKIAAINVAKITLEETISEARKNLDSEWNTVDLGSIQAGQKTGATATSANKSAAKEGHVLAINDQHGFIVVDLGKANGITGNSLLSLKQNGEVIATLTPLEIRDVMTACNVRDIKPGRKIAVNDSVSIQR